MGNSQHFGCTRQVTMACECEPQREIAAGQAGAQRNRFCIPTFRCFPIAAHIEYVATEPVAIYEGQASRGVQSCICFGSVPELFVSRRCEAHTGGIIVRNGGIGIGGSIGVPSPSSSGQVSGLLSDYRFSICSCCNVRQHRIVNRSCFVLVLCCLGCLFLCFFLCVCLFFCLV